MKTPMNLEHSSFCLLYVLTHTHLIYLSLHLYSHFVPYLVLLYVFLFMIENYHSIQHAEEFSYTKKQYFPELDFLKVMFTSITG